MVDDARLPNDLPIIERTAVRIVLLDAAGEVLLFHTHDPDHPDLGAWWELPGGGIDPGETYVEAAIRELREETGIVAERCQVGLQPGNVEHHFVIDNNDTSKTRWS